MPIAGRFYAGWPGLVPTVLRGKSYPLERQVCIPMQELGTREAQIDFLGQVGGGKSNIKTAKRAGLCHNGHLR